MPERALLIPVAPEELHDTDLPPGLLFIPFPFLLSPGQCPDIMPDYDPGLRLNQPVLTHDLLNRWRIRDVKIVTPEYPHPK
jgi:hypothetical protein